jgi:hypothetical protein
MHILQANLATNLVIAATIGFCALGVGFMLHFLIALTRERKAGLVGYRVEYGINNSLPYIARRHDATKVRTTIFLRADEPRGARGRSRTTVT